MRNMYCKRELMFLNKERNTGSKLCEDFWLQAGKVPKPLRRAGGLKRLWKIMAKRVFQTMLDC